MSLVRRDLVVGGASAGGAAALRALVRGLLSGSPEGGTGAQVG